MTTEIHYLNPLTQTHQIGPYLVRSSGTFRRYRGFQLHNRLTVQMWAPQSYSEVALVKSYPMQSPLPGNKGHEKAKRLWAKVGQLEMAVIRQFLVYMAPV